MLLQKPNLQKRIKRKLFFSNLERVAWSPLRETASEWASQAEPSLRTTNSEQEEKEEDESPY